LQGLTPTPTQRFLAMPKSFFAQVISTTLQAEFKKVSDGILRLECSKDWPVSEAVCNFFKISKNCHFFICRPFKKSEFPVKTITDDPKVATKWRNEKKRDFYVLLVGSTGGPLDSGLKDVRKITRQSIVNSWKKAVISKLPENDSELSKPEVKRLIWELFDYASTGAIQASSLEDYLESIFKDPKVETICKNMWILDLLPDSQAVDVGMARRRLARNIEISLLLKTSDDIRIVKKLQEV